MNGKQGRKSQVKHGRAGRKVRVSLPCGCVYPITIAPAFRATWGTFRLDALPATSRCAACRGVAAPPAPPPASSPAQLYAGRAWWGEALDEAR